MERPYLTEWKRFLNESVDLQALQKFLDIYTGISSPEADPEAFAARQNMKVIGAPSIKWRDADVRLIRNKSVVIEDKTGGGSGRYTILILNLDGTYQLNMANSNMNGTYTFANNVLTLSKPVQAPNAPAQ
jgi:hypothetical protein